MFHPAGTLADSINTVTVGTLGGLLGLLLLVVVVAVIVGTCTGLCVHHRRQSKATSEGMWPGFETMPTSTINALYVCMYVQSIAHSLYVLYPLKTAASLSGTVAWQRVESF